MHDVEILKLLALLGIDEHSVRALPLLPLVRVAWADGAVQEEERELILALARDRWSLGDEGAMLLRNGLTWPPSPGYLERGQVAIRACCAHAGDPDFRPELVGDVLELAREVARATGGLWGIGSVSREERVVLADLAAALNIPEGARWEEVRAEVGRQLHTEPPRARVVLRLDDDSTLDLAGRLGGALRSPAGDLEIPIVRRLVLGTASDADVQLENRGVEPHHCAVWVADSGRFYVASLSEQAVTRVDGERVLQRRLLGGETLGIGSAAMTFNLIRRVPPQLIA